MSYFKSIIERYWNYLPAFFCGMVIYILSTSGSIQLPEGWITSDKINHFVAYSVLTFLVFVGHSKEIVLTKPKIMATILLCTLYGVFLEIIQYTFYPNRFFEYGDALANFIGTIAGFLIFRQLFKNFND